ncbi:MAG: response regulator [Thermodesulfobacteriota bacterium]
MKLTLLLIENETYFQQILGNRFQREGFTLLCARRLAEAKTLVARKKIDVALLDLSALKGEGLGILKAIKQSRPLMEIITINNSDHFGLSLDAMKLGAYDDFLIPIDINALMDRIKAAGSQKKQNERQRRSVFQVYQDVMAAAAFAEAGEAETAKTIAEKKSKKRKTRKGDQNGG